MNTPNDNQDQDPQTAIDYNLYPSSARPSGLHVPSLVVPTDDHLRRIAKLEEENAKLKAELSTFHTAMQRERKPDWEKWHMELATQLDKMSQYWLDISSEDRQAMQTAARELRYMATAYTDSKALMDYINENAALADKSSKEWGAAGDKVNEAYRSGMWHAYNDIRNRIPHTHNYKSPEEVAAIVAERDERRVVMADIVRTLGHACCGLSNSEIVPEITRQLTARTQALKVAKEAIADAIDALLKSYDAQEWPARGRSLQERTAVQLRIVFATINNLLK